jgi:hypothetical protein
MAQEEREAALVGFEPFASFSASSSPSTRSRLPKIVRAGDPAPVVKIGREKPALTAFEIMSPWSIWAWGRITVRTLSAANGKVRSLSCVPDFEPCRLLRPRLRFVTDQTQSVCGS